MGLCLSLCTGNPPTWTSIYSGTVTITSQQSLVLSTPLPTGPKQYVAILIFSKKEKVHLRKALTQCKYPKWALDKVEKRLNKPSSEVSDEANNQGTAGALPATQWSWNQGSHCHTLYKRSLCKVSKRSVGGMAYRPTSKVVITSGTYWSPPRTKTLWSAKVGPYIGSNMVTSPVMINI